jgi:hypothetical protein
MRKPLVILRTVLAALFLGGMTPQFAQNTCNNSSSPDRERRSHAMSILRAIGTVEVGELSKYGSYSSWQTLLAHEPKYFDKFLALNYPQATNLHFGDPPEVLPGWSLRFSVHADGQGYDVRLQDLTDKRCWYAALLDEEGVIRQSKAIGEIGCEI